MFSFQAKNPNLGKFWRALDWKMLLYFTISYRHLGYFMTIGYILCSVDTFFGLADIYQEKSGNSE
jgi:hypothetical protein